MNVEITNGDIIRFYSDNVRDWVAIHYTNCNDVLKRKYNKNIKDQTGFYLFGFPLSDGDASTDKPYCKYAGMLKRGMLPNMRIVGNINNKRDFENYKNFGKI